MSRSKYKNLIIVGNGFDRWQGLPTSYDEFRKFYLSHIEETIRKMGVERICTENEIGGDGLITPVELVYGDPFNATKMPDEFFWNLESALDKIDDQQLNLFFGRSKVGIKDLRKTVKAAQQILQRLFCDWVASLSITSLDTEYRISYDCYCINFNYTDTLQKRFGVDNSDVYHIHGTARHPESIIVGHSTHPETAFKELIEHHFMKSLKSGGLPRIEGLYAIEDVLYQTDKHVVDNIDRMCEKMLRRGVHIEDFENIYVLGHSLSETDFEYFDYIDHVTRCGCNFDLLSAAEKLDKDLLGRILSNKSSDDADDTLLEQIRLNIDYAVHHRERAIGKVPVSYPDLESIDSVIYQSAYGREEYYSAEVASNAEKAVLQRFLYEQASRTQEVLIAFMHENGFGNVPEGCHSFFGLSSYMGNDPRKRNATWHISYHTHADKKRIEKVMREMRQKRYELYPSIDECLDVFRTAR